jgi:hypothetical protein
MTRSRRLGLMISLGGLLLIIGLFGVFGHCPPQGIAFSRETRAFHSLKNRTTLPQKSDFEDAISLTSILQPGDDRARWSTSRAGRVEGYIVSVAKGPVELANCYLPCRRDIHIHLALHPNAPAREQMVVEITPRMEDWAKRQGWDWSEGALKREMLGHWCYFEGWLLFDSTHADESENTVPQAPHNWRATAWEIHPVTYLKVIR